MSIKVNKKAPNFSLFDQNNNKIELYELKLNLVLFFYPKDNTPGCTKEAISFSKYKNKTTAILCSSNCIIPMWAFMLVASELNNITSEFYSGNKDSVFQKLFLKNIENINPIKFKDKKVIIKGCSQISIEEIFYITITKPQFSTIIFNIGLFNRR